KRLVHEWRTSLFLAIAPVTPLSVSDIYPSHGEHAAGDAMTIRQQAKPTEADEAELLVKVFHDSPAAISIVDFDDWKYIAANQAFLQMTGLERDEIVGRTSERVSLWADE